MGELPNWVYDLINEVERQRDVHPALYVQPAGSAGYRRYDWCSCALLDLVPEDVRRDAAAIREYLRRVKQTQLLASRGEVTPPSGDRPGPPHTDINGSEGVQHNE